MNRSCNSILCRFGIHTADPYVHIQVKCRITNCEEYAERCMPVISCCRDCFYYKGCEDCAISDDCDRMEDKHE